MKLWNLFDAACDFPWQDGGFKHLERYIVAVDKFQALAHDFQSKVIRDAISAETHPVALGELQYELTRLNEEDAFSNQRVVWGGLLVSIYAMFEHGLEQIFEHWRLTTSGPVFKAKGGEDLMSAAIRHAKDCIALNLFETAVERRCLDELRILRKSFVHKGGKIFAVPSDTWAAIQSRKQLGFPLEVNDDQWSANAFAAQYYLHVAQRVMKRFTHAVFSKLSPS
jgi:hypothetical protein